MSDDGVYLRRVKDPNPLLEALARQALDSYEQQTAMVGGERGLGDVARLADNALRFGVPLAYLLDERERRVRAGRTPEKSEG